MKTIVNMLFGSHLYGLDTLESDKDYKGIYLPEIDDVLLQRVQKSISRSTGDHNSKNTKGDIDSEFYSLQYFIELACQGQTVAIDMLHAPKSMILESSLCWSLIVQNRERFYSKNITAFVGYCRRQASKYGIKGSRLSDARQVVEYLYTIPTDTQLKEVWDKLPSGEHIHHLPPNENDKAKLRLYQVVGKKFIENARAAAVIGSLEVFIQQAGERAMQAERNEGIDWKAVSHAIRAATQIEQLLTEGTITFPLHNSDYIKSVKLGELDYLKEVGPKLEDMMAKVEELQQNSDLPANVDRKWWDKFLSDILHEEYSIGE
jgi:predicted nucleotidyltransferase